MTIWPILLLSPAPVLDPTAVFHFSFFWPAKEDEENTEDADWKANIKPSHGPEFVDSGQQVDEARYSNKPHQPQNGHQDDAEHYFNRRIHTNLPVWG